MTPPELLDLLTITPARLALTAFAVFLGGVSQGATGQAFGIIIAPLFALTAPERLPAVVLLLGALITAMGAAREFRDVRLRIVAPAVMGRATGAGLGAAMLALLAATDKIALAVAIVVLAGVALSLARFRVPITSGTLYAAGAASGLMSTVASIGTPPLALLYQYEDASKVRGTLNVVFLLGILFSLAAVGFSGLIQREDMIFTALMTPFLAAGFLASGPVIRAMGGRSLRPVALSLSAGAALLVIIRALL